MTLYSQIARAALREYELPEHRLTLLGDAENVTYRVQFRHAGDDEAGEPAEADNSAWDPRKLLLRIHRPQGHVRARLWNPPPVVQSELEWLKQITLSTPNIVPLPLRSGSGSEVVTVAVNGVDYVCTLMRWVRGRYTTVTPSRHTGFSAGVATAWAHKASQEWIGHEVSGAMSGCPSFEEFDFEFQSNRTTLLTLKLTQALVRPVYDSAMLCGWKRIMLSRASAHGMPEELSGRISATLDRAEVMLNGKPITHDSFGLVHADLIPDNYVVYRKSLRLIDFSSCGFGWYLHDIGVALSYLMKDAQRPFLLGYQSIRPLSDRDLQELQTFVTIARISIILEYWPDQCIYAPLDPIDEILPDRQLAGGPFA